MINFRPFRIRLNHHISVNEVTFGLNGNDPGWQGAVLPLCLCLSLMMRKLLPLLLVAMQV